MSRACIVCLIAAVVAVPGRALAQAAPPQRPGGLFGTNVSDPGARQSLNLTMSSTGGYDTSATPEGRVEGASVGYSSMLVGAADYTLQNQHAQLRATGTSAGYFRPLDNSALGSDTYTGAVGFSARSRKNTVVVNTTAMYSSWPLQNLFARPTEVMPGDAPAAQPDYVNNSRFSSYGTSMVVSRTATRNTTLSATGIWQQNDTLASGAGRWDLGMYGVGGQLAHRLTRGTTATAGYVYRTGAIDYHLEGGGPQTLAEQGVEVGVNYRRALSRTRNLTLGGQLGDSSMLMPGPIDAAAEPQRRTRQLSGQATGSYEFGRSWQARATYRRGVDYVTGLTEPVTAATLTTGVSGLLAQRVDLLISGAHSNGASTLNRSRSAFDVYAADVRVRYAFTRLLAAYTEYLYYIYDSQGAPLAPGMPLSLTRKGVRVGLMLRISPF